MGDSAKLEPSGPERYRLVEQRLYLDALLQTMGVRANVTLVLHDWGSVLGFDWANNRHRDAVKGIVYMEAVVRPTSAEDLPEGSLAMFEALRSPAGEKLILEENMYGRASAAEDGVAEPVCAGDGRVPGAVPPVGRGPAGDAHPVP